MIRRLVSRLLLGLFQINDYGFLVVASILMVLEAILSTVVIQKVPYTEIDWSTYMQQVECYIKGTMNYTKIGGDTGPIVYPAGHIWIYRVLYALTDSGKSIRTAQHVFQLLYLTNVFFVFRIFYKSRVIPPFVLFLVTVTGYRIHSIFMLRLFNDPVAMLLFYVALDQFLEDKWTVGCVFYSFAVSIKMNVLLFAPALFFTLLLNNGPLHTLGYIALCGAIQLYVGGPFLFYDWKSYVVRSFDLGRVFMFKWTVNWRFLPEDLFLDKRFHIALLVGHLTVLALFALFMWFRPHNGLRPSVHQMLFRGIPTLTGPTDIIYAFFTANLIGIAFSRSLHYQFYSWYFHQLPFLLFCYSTPVTTVSSIPWKSYVWKILLLLAVELSWNVYPSTWWSSGLLHACHAVLFWYLVVSRPEKPKDSIHPSIHRRHKNKAELFKKITEEEPERPRGPTMTQEEFEELMKKREEEKQKREQNKGKKKEASEEEQPNRMVRTLPNGKKIPVIYESEKEMNSAFSRYWKGQLKDLRNTHQVYLTDNGDREVTGLPPVGDKSKLSTSDKIKLLYADALYLKEQIRQDIIEEHEAEMGRCNGNGNCTHLNGNGVSIRRRSRSRSPSLTIQLPPPPPSIPAPGSIGDAVRRRPPPVKVE